MDQKDSMKVKGSNLYQWKDIWEKNVLDGENGTKTMN